MPKWDICCQREGRRVSVEFSTETELIIDRQYRTYFVKFFIIGRMKLSIEIIEIKSLDARNKFNDDINNLKARWCNDVGSLI